MPQLLDITATELKQNLGYYLTLLKEGKVIQIRKHGEYAAVLLPYGSLEEDAEAAHTLTGTAESVPPYRAEHGKTSYEAFMKLYEKTESRMELLDGDIHLLASPSVSHQNISCNLLLSFRNHLKGKPCKAFTAPFDVHLVREGSTTPNVCQPDVLIACDLAEHVSREGRYTGIPTLVVEILSEATRSKDMVQKLAIYMQSGIREYWVVDPQAPAVLVYWKDENGHQRYQVYGREDVIPSTSVPDLLVAVADILSP